MRSEQEKKQIIWDIEEKILEVANLYSQVTTSDLQGIATAKAHEIYNLFKEEP